MLYSAILTFRIFPDNDRVHIFISSLESGNAFAGTDIGKQIEGFA